MTDNATGDLDDRAAIHDVVVGFYREIVMDEVLAPLFTEVAEVDWAEHIPLLVDYWCRVLLGDDAYRGSILAAHRHVHDQEAFRVEHFERWLRLFTVTVDQRASGPFAERAKLHARRTASTIARQVAGIAGPGVPTEQHERS